ncbi:glutamate synthase-related protein [Streptomyces swartbergensis]|uniref:glutamate synthase-related protein n=1 Tax=Streptomyces swartbergensis TaxID=487165 RepID=UPI00382E49CE
MVQALQELGVHREVQLIVSSSIRNGADMAKALALGADAVAFGAAALIALGDHHPKRDAGAVNWASPPGTSTTPPSITFTKKTSKPPTTMRWSVSSRSAPASTGRRPGLSVRWPSG